MILVEAVVQVAVEMEILCQATWVEAVVEVATTQMLGVVATATTAETWTCQIYKHWESIQVATNRTKVQTWMHQWVSDDQKEFCAHER